MSAILIGVAIVSVLVVALGYRLSGLSGAVGALVAVAGLGLLGLVFSDPQSLKSSFADRASLEPADPAPTVADPTFPLSPQARERLAAVEYDLSKRLAEIEARKQMREVELARLTGSVRSLELAARREAADAAEEARRAAASAAQREAVEARRREYDARMQAEAQRRLAEELLAREQEFVMQPPEGTASTPTEQYGSGGGAGYVAQLPTTPRPQPSEDLSAADDGLLFDTPARVPSPSPASPEPAENDDAQPAQRPQVPDQTVAASPDPLAATEQRTRTMRDFARLQGELAELNSEAQRVQTDAERVRSIAENGIFSGSAHVAHNAPGEMQYGQDYQIEMALAPEVLGIDPEKLLSADLVGTIRHAGPVDYALRMRASLIGSDFAIDPPEPQVRRIPEGRGMTWSWVVRPVDFGDGKRLTFRLEALYRDEGGALEVVAEETYRATVLVRVTFPERVALMLERIDPLQKTLAGVAGLAMALAGFYFTHLRRKHKAGPMEVVIVDDEAGDDKARG